MEVHLVADTNLFFERKSLEQLPWLELGYDPVAILLTKPVLDEIDRHKKANGRTRSRALEIFGRVRDILTSSAQDVEIRSSSPRVVLRRMANVKPDPALKEDLDYAKTDERLIGIASALNGQTSGHRGMLFTDDTGPAATAEGLGVPYLMINESWRRPPSETTEDKKIKELEKDLATYRAQEPKISIGRCETADESDFVGVTRKVATPLQEVEIERILTALRLKHPLVTDFTPPPPSSTTGPSGEVTKIVFVPPVEVDIANYRDVLYPQWMARCREILKHLHEGRDESEGSIVLRWRMTNGGTRPASQVRVEFEAKGPLALRRLPPHAEHEEDAEPGDASSLLLAATVPGFPPMPRPPSFREQVNRIPPPAKPRQTHGLDISTATAFASFDQHHRRLADLSKALGSGPVGPLSHYLKGSDAIINSAELLRHQSGMFDASASAISFKALKLPEPYIPIPHNPEGFYYDWPATGEVKKGALTCELWRHQAGDEIFEFEVLFTKEGEARGAVECTVHAQNLTNPEQARVIVSRTVELLSMMDLGNAMVEASR